MRAGLTLCGISRHSRKAFGAFFIDKNILEYLPQEPRDENNAE